MRILTVLTALLATWNTPTPVPALDRAHPTARNTRRSRLTRHQGEREMLRRIRRSYQ